MATTIPNFTADQFAERMMDLFPRGWASSDAVSSGGVLYSLALAIGQSLQYLSQTEITYVDDATRLQTSIDGALDTFAQDFFGNTLPRTVGESDATYEKRIVLNLFPQPRVTRPGVATAISQLTGVMPRMSEPWAPSDTAVWNGPIGYYDVDVTQMPGRWGDPSLRYIGFIDTATITAPVTGQNPVYAIDIGLSLDVSTGYLWDPSPYWYSSGVYELAAFLQLIKAWGTQIWFRVVPPGYLTTKNAGVFAPVVWRPFEAG